MLLGQGGTFFKESVQAIKDIGYEGWILSETFYNRRNMNENGMDYVSSAKAGRGDAESRFRRVRYRVATPAAEFSAAGVLYLLVIMPYNR